ncbi:MAG: dihydropyrimidinase [Candidatus Methanofastidiosia archaeon]
MKLDMLIKNGKIITESDTFIADVGVKDKKIVKIAKKINDDADEIIEAKGKYVLPGAIDVHTHLHMPFMGAYSVDDYKTGTVAAACGGITSVVDFDVQAEGETLREAVERKKKLAYDQGVAIDFSLHPCVTQWGSGPADWEKTIAEIPGLIKEGVPSFKVFTTYGAWEVQDEAMLKLLETTKRHGGLVQVHAENNDIIQFMNKKFDREGKLDPLHHALSRPPEAELEAVERLINLTKLLNSRIYFVHLSTKLGLEAIKKARAEGYNIMCETCPQYLLLSINNYKEPEWNGAKYVMSPPLRTREDQEALWNGLKYNYVKIVSTDHCPFNFGKEKRMLGGEKDYKKIPNGAPGIEVSLMLMHSEGVTKRRISINDLVRIISTNPAKIFGLQNKGSIAIGKDADIVVYDPKTKWVMTNDKLHMNVDYTPYEGLKMTGKPEITISKGRVIARGGEFVGDLSWGKFVKRKLDY